MTIKTLEYIHNLLIEEEAKTSAVYNASRNLQREFEERDQVDEDLIKSQKEAADKCMKDHLTALNALEEFEATDW